MSIAILILLIHSSTSVLLTPGNPSKDGASVHLIQGVTDYAPFEWDLYAMGETQFNMKIHLNKSWAFHAQYTTTLTLQIDSDTLTDITDTALIVSFSQNNAKYITAVIQIGAENEDHLIYPAPFDDANQKQIYGEGDIEALVSDSDIDRIDAATNNGSYGYFNPFTSAPNISYPLQFTLENNPYFNYMILTYSNPACKARHILYYGLDTNQTFDIYISAAVAGDNFDITAFNLTHYVSDTTAIISTLMPVHTQDIYVQDVASVDLLETSLVIVLISTVAILCCVCCLFSVMFSTMLRNHKKMIENKPMEKKTDKAENIAGTVGPVVVSKRNSGTNVIYEEKEVHADGGDGDLEDIYDSLKIDYNGGPSLNNGEEEEKKCIDVDVEDMYDIPTTTNSTRLTLSAMMSGMSVPEGTISKHTSPGPMDSPTVQSSITPYTMNYNQHPLAIYNQHPL